MKAETKLLLGYLQLEANYLNLDRVEHQLRKTQNYLQKKNQQNCTLIDVNLHYLYNFFDAQAR